MDPHPLHHDDVASECAYRRQVASECAYRRQVASECAYRRQVEAERAGLDRSELGFARLRADLAAELGIAAGPLVDDLLDLGITPGTAPAFEALPLVQVAWADGEIDPEERWRVLSEATAFGLELGRAAHALLELWLSQPPKPELFDAWCRFASLTETAGRARRVLAGCEAVAAAAGGVLGFGAASASEREMIARVRAPFERPFASGAA